MRTRIKNLPQQIKVWKDRKEISLELQKRAIIYNFHLHNLLTKKLYEKSN